MRKMAKLHWIWLLTGVLLAGCKGETGDTNTADLEQIATLQSEVEQLKLDNQLKDSMLNESILYFNEIQRNLAAIQLKEDEIRVRAKHAEKDNNEKLYVLHQIQYINFLREENGKKLAALQTQLKNSSLKISQMQEMVTRLSEQLAEKEQHIQALQAELAVRDREYALLFDEYQEQWYQNEQLMEQIQTVYYAVGSLKELITNQVVVQSKGLLGMGRMAKLKDGFNESYFTKTSVQETARIAVAGKRLSLVTDHPSTAYRIVEEGGVQKLKITNPDAFWKVSKFLVVLVD